MSPNIRLFCLSLCNADCNLAVLFRVFGMLIMGAFVCTSAQINKSPNKKSSNKQIPDQGNPAPKCLLKTILLNASF
jgi:hypothetical protein